MITLSRNWPVELIKPWGCLEWRGKTDKDGYGVCWLGQGVKRAHIVIYTAEIGPVPEGYELEHICRNRACCNPEHLEPVTRSQNELRKKWAVRVRIKKCKKGHDMGLYAIVTPNGGRVCRRCRDEMMCDN